MEALNNYLSSSESDDENTDQTEQKKPIIDKPKDTNFFNLDDNYEKEFENGVQCELNKIKNSILIKERTNELHDYEYGPSYQINRLEINQTKNLTKRKQNDFNILPPPKKQPKIEIVQNEEFKKFDKTILNPNSKIEKCQINSIGCTLPKSCLKYWRGHSACITSVTWNIPNLSHLLLSASLDGTIKLWNRFSPEFCKVINIHTSGVKKALFTLCGTKIFSGSLDKTAAVFDITTGKQLNRFLHSHFVTSAQVSPTDPNLYLTGTFDKACLWDGRSQSVVRSYASNCGQVLDLLFISGGSQFVCATEVVSRDSPNRTLMVWDTATGAKLSNQIYQEFYTCSSLRQYPGREQFVAQSSGGYVAIFSTQSPYKLNKRKVFEGHKMDGYPISCDFSPDGQYLASGDADGRTFVYHGDTTRVARTLPSPNQLTIPSTTVAWHPVLSSNIAIGYWDGHLAIYQ